MKEVNTERGNSCKKGVGGAGVLIVVKQKERMREWETWRKQLSVLLNKAEEGNNAKPRTVIFELVLVVYCEKKEATAEGEHTSSHASAISRHSERLLMASTWRTRTQHCPTLTEAIILERHHNSFCSASFFPLTVAAKQQHSVFGRGRSTRVAFHVHYAIYSKGKTNNTILYAIAILLPVNTR